MLAHELGHFFLHLSSNTDYIEKQQKGFKSDETERQATDFGKELLMPRELFSDIFKVLKTYSLPTKQVLVVMSDIFVVSEETINCRLNELRLNCTTELHRWY